MERRDFVRKSGITGVVLLTGCLGGGNEESPGEEGDGEEEGTTDSGEEEDGDTTDSGEEEDGDTTDSGDDGYKRFMYDPEAAGLNKTEYVFTYTSSRASEEMRREQGTEGSPGAVARVEQISTGTSTGGLPTQGDTKTVFIRKYPQEGGSFDEITGELSDPVESHSGYEIYESGDSVLALNEDEGITVGGPDLELVRLVTDTLSGNTESFVEGDDDIRVLVEALGSGDAVSVSGRGPEADQVPGSDDVLASGFVFSERNGSIDVTYGLVYPDQESATAAVREEMEPSEEGEDLSEEGRTPLSALMATDLGIGDLEITNQSAVGRVAVLEGSVNRDGVLGSGSGLE